MTVSTLPSLPEPAPFEEPDLTLTGTPALDHLLKRRSVVAKEMIGPGPDDTQLRHILRAATRVPDHGKLAPWRIQILREAGQRKLGDLFAELFAADNPTANEKQIGFERDRPLRAPLLLVVTSKPIIPHKIPAIEQTLSAGAVCQNILNAATALGFAAQWLSEWPCFRPEVRALLGHDSPHDQIAGFMYIGSAASPPKERPRPVIDAVATVWEG
ncbi:MAG: nitroreductase [Pseudomonadota bacterium]